MKGKALVCVGHGAPSIAQASAWLGIPALVYTCKSHDLESGAYVREIVDRIKKERAVGVYIGLLTPLSLGPANGDLIQGINRQCCKIAETAQCVGVPWIVYWGGLDAHEPHSCRCLANLDTCLTLTVDRCLYGGKWKAASVVTIGNLEDSDTNPLKGRCEGMLCSRTGLKHKPSRRHDKIMATLPRPLARALATVATCVARATF